MKFYIYFFMRLFSLTAHVCTYHFLISFGLTVGGMFIILSTASLARPIYSHAYFLSLVTMCYVIRLNIRLVYS